jgi:UV DNA damage endonuclease
VAAAVRELDFMAELCDVLGADALTVHGGGRAGGTAAALDRLARGLDRLGDRARALVALENDDRLFAPADLLPLCRSAGVPLVYDVHHHRCHPDALSVREATEAAAATWGAREPWTHVASPRDGWTAPNPRPHAPLVDPADFPAEWLGRRMTIDVEAKDKERAVLAIRDAVAALAGGERPATSCTA